MELLNKIQQALKVPKSHHNSFGNYDYRNAEDILEAAKPLLGKGVLVVSDEIVNVGTRYYVKATATLSESKKLLSPVEMQQGAGPFYESVTSTAYARESEDKKGMDSAQITGAASSYARKYALNGLFLIDDAKDADGEDNTAPEQPKKAPVAFAKPPVYKSDDIKEQWVLAKSDDIKEQEAKKRIVDLISKLRPDDELLVSDKVWMKKYYGDKVQELTGHSLELASLEELENIGDALGELFDKKK